jgi:hypothetical protein
MENQNIFISRMSSSFHTTEEVAGVAWRNIKDVFKGIGRVIRWLFVLTFCAIGLLCLLALAFPKEAAPVVDIVKPAVKEFFLYVAQHL